MAAQGGPPVKAAAARPTTTIPEAVPGGDPTPVAVTVEGTPGAIGRLTQAITGRAPGEPTYLDRMIVRVGRKRAAEVVAEEIDALQVELSGTRQQLRAKSEDEVQAPRLRLKIADIEAQIVYRGGEPLKLPGA